MSNDISDSLLEAIQATYDEEVKNSKLIPKLLKKIKSGKATYDDAHKYAEELGRCLEMAFKANVSEEMLPNGRMYYNIALKLLEPTLKHNYAQIAVQVENIQNALNASAGLGLKAVPLSYDEKRTNRIAQYIADAEKYSIREESFLNTITNNALSYVDLSVRQNADFQYKSGLNAKIVRTAAPGACEWCQTRAGTYNYEDVKNTGNDVFRRHANCRCTVTYYPASGEKTVHDIWSKTWVDDDLVAKRENFVASRVTAETVKEALDGLKKS